MAHTFEELKNKTVAQLREIASGIEHEAVKGYTQLNKEHLFEAVCKALSIEMHEQHAVKGIDKADIKAQIKELKKERTKVIEAHDHAKLKNVRRKIHRLKRKLRSAMV